MDHSLNLVVVAGAEGGFVVLDEEGSDLLEVVDLLET